MGRVIHFEIHADNTARAVGFYTKVFGWKISKWDGPAEYWLITTGDDSNPGINGAIMKRQTAPPTGSEAITSYTCTIHVDTIDDAIKKVTTHGGTIVLHKQPVPGVGYLAYARDTEGNVFGMMSSEDVSSK
jgi:uncharacterized protein